MNAKSLAIALLGLCLAIVLGIAWTSHRSAKEAEVALALLGKKRIAMEAGVQHLQKTIVFDDRDNRDIKAAITAQKEVKAPRGTVRITPQMNGPAMLALLASDPKLFALGMKAFQANLNVNFAPIFRALNLTPDQITKFDSLAVTHQEAIIDILSSATTEGLPLSDPSVRTLMQQENAQYQTAEQGLLGDPAYQQMQQMNRALPVTGIVRDVAMQVALTSTPLSSAQADQLTQILASSSGQYQNGGYAMPGSINWPAALGQAQAILSPGQLAALQGRYNSIQVGQLRAQFEAQQKGN